LEGQSKHSKAHRFASVEMLAVHGVFLRDNETDYFPLYQVRRSPEYQVKGSPQTYSSILLRDSEADFSSMYQVRGSPEG